MEKVCIKCNVSKSITMFSKNKNYSDGLRRSCKSCENAYNKLHYENNKDHVRAVHKSYYNRTTEKSKDRTRNYREKNGDRIRARHLERSKTDEQYRLSRNLRYRIYSAIKYGYKAASSQILLGCSIQFLKQYLEMQFLTGMEWSNYGKLWHIDHIRPCASFNLTDPEQQKECFYYMNLQPLWAVDNLKKGSKYPGENLTTLA
jgi:hypothetical protein